MNPACQHDNIPGDAGMGIDIPYNDNNRALLGNPERFEKDGIGADREFPNFELRFDGFLLMSGTLVIQSATTESYSGWLRSNLGNFGKEQQEKKLPDMAWKQDQEFENKTEYNDTDDEYGLYTILNPGFWDGIGKEEKIETKVKDENGVWQVREDSRTVLKGFHLKNYGFYVNPAYPRSNPQAGMVISPFLYLKYVIKESLRLNKWFINRNDMIIPDLILGAPFDNAMIYNNFNIVDLNDVTTRTITGYEYDYVTDEVKEVSYDVLAMPGWEIKNFNYSDLLPRISMKDFILGIQNSLNFIFRFRNDGRVDIVDRNNILEKPANNINEFHLGTFEINERKNVRLKFTPEYDKDDALFGTGYEDLSDRWKDYGEPVLSLDDLRAIASPKIGELRLVVYENNIYEYSWVVVEQEDYKRQETPQDTLSWHMISTGPQPYIYGDQEEEEEIKTPLSTLQTSTLAFLPIGKADQKGNIGTLKSVYSDFTFRVVPQNIYISQPLFWEGGIGLFENRWKNWAHFWKNRLPIETEFQMPLNVLSFCIDNITDKFATEAGQFVIEEMTTDFGLNEIGKTRIKGYKV